MKQSKRPWFKSSLNGALTIIIFLLIGIILKVFLIEIYKITSISMDPTLIPGDFIIVSKITYGARLLKPVKFFKQNKIEYVRTKGWRSLKKGDILVFNLPRYNKYSDSSYNIYGVVLVKRCNTLPGDSVIIKNEGLSLLGELKNDRINNPENEDLHRKFNLFPGDSSLNWSLDNYGPIYVPARGDTLNLTKRNVLWYKDILRYENTELPIKSSILMIDGKTFLQYTFQHNYYFMMGDNFYSSEDSRYWGFVPEGNIIGKASVVLFSIDPNEHGIKKIRWKRIFKII